MLKEFGQRCGEIAQQVEQRPEKPCVPSSILGLATRFEDVPRGVPFLLYELHLTQPPSAGIEQPQL